MTTRPLSLANSRPITAGTILASADAMFTVYLAPIDFPSDDHRVIVGELGWREPPLPFMASDSESGHGDAVHVGNLDQFQRETVDGVDWVTAQLTYDTDPVATEFRRLATEGKFNGVSIHMGKVDFWPVRQVDGEWVKLTEDELNELYGPVPVEIVEAEAEGTEDVDPWAEIYDGAFGAEIAAATQVAIPAFPGSKILTAAATEPMTFGGITMSENVITSVSTSSGVASEPESPIESDATLVAASLERPPAQWFQNPELTEATPLTVEDDGRVYGHLALWDSCHTGYQGRCVTPPRNPDFTNFMTCRVITDDGARTACGPLVVDDGHAPESWSTDKTIRYYADTRLAAAYVSAGVDEIGVWVAGAVSHNATESQVETLRRHPLSGDWRTIDGQYQLVAAVAVNAPGFPIPEVLAASGEPVGLITVGPVELIAEQSDLGLVASALAQMVGRLDQMGIVLDTLAGRVTEQDDLEAASADADRLLADL